MSAESAIEWTDATWNPVRGCEAVSPGCALCYAAGVAARFSGEGQPYEGLALRKPGQPAKWTGKVVCVEDKLAEPLKWRKPKRIFVNSMSDLFHKDVPDEFIARVFAVMALAPQHTFQVLTKRADRMAAYLNRVYARGSVADAAVKSFERYIWWNTVGHERKGNEIAGSEWPLPNVWLGVSCENQAAADDRIPHLLRTPAAVRFLSCEPLLGPVDLRPKAPDAYAFLGKFYGTGTFDPTGMSPAVDRVLNCFPRIDWVIVGGESGHGARPMHPDWARSLRDQCQAAGVAFFFKQWGEFFPSGMYDFDTQLPRLTGHPEVYVGPKGQVALCSSPFEHGCPSCSPPRHVSMVRVGKKAAGRSLDDREWNQFPEVRA